MCKELGYINGYGECSDCCAARAKRARAALGIDSDYGPEADAVLDRVCASFPQTFGLRHHKGEFRVSRSASFISEGTVWVYTQIIRNGEWLDFAKGTPEELRQQMV